MFTGTRCKCISRGYHCVIVLLCSCALCFADKIVLKEGQIVTGDILVEKQTQLYIDIGIMVLTIPKDKILTYEYTKTDEAADDAEDSQAKAGEAQRVTSGPMPISPPATTVSRSWTSATRPTRF